VDQSTEMEMLVTGIKVRPARTRPPEANRPPDASRYLPSGETRDGRDGDIFARVTRGEDVFTKSDPLLSRRLLPRD
jgi:hypothetical protein